MTKTQATRAILAASDEGGTIQADAMLALCQCGALPMGRPELHAAMSVESALRAAGLTADEIDTALDA